MPKKQPPWQKPLDTLLSSIEALDDSLKAVPGNELTKIVGQLRGANRQVWRMIDSLEAGRVQYLYDVNRLLRDVYGDPNHEDPTESWVYFHENGVLNVNHKELLKLAEKRGISVADYLEEVNDDVDG